MQSGAFDLGFFTVVMQYCTVERCMQRPGGALNPKPLFKVKICIYLLYLLKLVTFRYIYFN